MTIKQLGGIFGRNPTFEDVTIEGTLTFDGDIDVNSDLKVAGDIETTGNVIIATSGKGIDFSATSGTGTSELFDDYEEGTWTPQSTISGLTSNTGWYTKVGNQVTAWYQFTVTSASSSVIRLTGFPFAASSGYQGVITLCGAQSAAAGPFQWNTTPDIRNGSDGVVSHGTLTGSIVYGFFTYQT